MPIYLTDEQKKVAQHVLRDVKSGNKQVVSMSGYAGTGKTTVIRILAKLLKSFSVCAFTGKAANVLRKKRIPDPSTIHSLIYRSHFHDDGTVHWSLVPKYELFCDGFIVDEASMVSEEIFLDLVSFDKPIILVGDHGQLEPIGTDFNLMASPDYKLETIHRSADEIAHFANHLREGNTPQSFKTERLVQIIEGSLIEDRHYASTNQVICAFNKTRVEINERVRRHLGLHYSFIGIGEKIMCLRNNKNLGLFNGLQGTVESVGKDERFTFKSDDGFVYTNIEYDPDTFGKLSYEYNREKQDCYKNPFDYGYTITGHKAQGDEWSNIIVVAQNCTKWDLTRWNYTVASRAKEGLIWARQ